MKLSKNQVTSFSNNIFSVDTGYTREKFAAVHLVIENDKVLIIDTGTVFSVKNIQNALERLGLSFLRVEWIILTHIHLDHAGGAGQLMKNCPNATLGVHKKGKRHLVDPTRLWTSVLSVYGEAKAKKLYGELIAIEESRIEVLNEGVEINFHGRVFEIWDTPGHAKHHILIRDTKTKAMFSGDTFGVSYREFDTEQGCFCFISSTPTQFEPFDLSKSIRRILAASPPEIYLTHYSKVGHIQKIGQELLLQVDEYVQIANESKEYGAQTLKVIQEKMLALLMNKAIDHGYTGSKKRITELIWLDVTLNSAGLANWLNASS